jgi:dihydroxy-acid dehydratase
MMLGCSTNTALHLPAIAGAAGLDIELEDFDKISKIAPQVCKLSPSGKTFNGRFGYGRRSKRGNKTGYRRRCNRGKANSVTMKTIGKMLKTPLCTTAK